MSTHAPSERIEIMLNAHESARWTQPKRVMILVTAALVGHGALVAFHLLDSPSERFHALVPLLWLLDVSLHKLERKTASLGAMIGVAFGLLFLFFWNGASMQARMMGGRSDWREPLIKSWLIASFFVLFNVLYQSLAMVLRSVPALRDLLNESRGWWLRGLRIVVTLGWFFPYTFTSLNAHRFKVHNVATPQTRFHLPFEPVTFRAAEDGVRISGWFIPSRNSRATVVVCHGLGVNKSVFLGVAPFLHRAGFNILMFDFRGHGDSGGHTTSFGFYEARDVAGAVGFLARRDPSMPIVALAYSMGGAALLHAAGDLPQLRGVVVDSTFSEFAPLVLNQIPPLPLFARRLVLGASDFYGRLELGVSMRQIASRPLIARVSPRPLLIIHGTDDGLIPPSQARENFAAARQPKELWMIQGAEHCGGHATAGAQYEKRVIAFLRRCVQSGH